MQQAFIVSKLSEKKQFGRISTSCTVIHGYLLLSHHFRFTPVPTSEDKVEPLTSHLDIQLSLLPVGVYLNTSSSILSLSVLCVCFSHLF